MTARGRWLALAGLPLCACYQSMGGLADDTTGAGTMAVGDSSDTGSTPHGDTADPPASTGADATMDAGSDGPPVCQSPEVTCGQQCADLDTDPNNCGLCGRTCVIANAEAGCASGQCTLLACAQGYSDCDGMLATGCEAAVDCSGGPCATACGTTGMALCDNGCEASCVGPVESCNAIDDDCNDQCDEGPLLDCRAGVHRSNSPTLGHFYTTDLVEASSGDLTVEAQDFFFVYHSAVDGLSPLFRCIKGNGRRLYTSSIDCEGTGAPELTVGFMAAGERCGSIPLYRVWQPTSDAHFYTTSAGERDNAVVNLGYQDQGIVGHVWPSL